MGYDLQKRDHNIPIYTYLLTWSSTFFDLRTGALMRQLAYLLRETEQKERFRSPQPEKRRNLSPWCNDRFGVDGAEYHIYILR